MCCCGVKQGADGEDIGTRGVHILCSCRGGPTLLSSGHAVSMVTAIEESLFSFALRRIKKLSGLIARRAEVGAFARSLNDTRLANIPLRLSWSRSESRA